MPAPIFISIVFVLLSQELFSSEKHDTTNTYQKLPDSEKHNEQPIEAIAVSFENSESMQSLLTTYTNSRTYLEDQRDSALHERNQARTRLATCESTIRTLNSTIAQLRTTNTAQTAEISQKNITINNLQRRLQEYQNQEEQEFQDLSCSIVGPKYSTILCSTICPTYSNYTRCKSQSLNKNIELRTRPRFYGYHYYNTAQQKYLGEFQYCENTWRICLCDPCCCSCCCMQSKLPDYVGIRPRSDRPHGEEYYDKRDNSTIENRMSSCSEDCYILMCCCIKNANNHP